MNCRIRFRWPLCGLLILVLSASLNAADEFEHRFKKQMNASHVGTEAGPSPLGVVLEQLKSDKPDWEVIAKNNGSLHTMAKMIEQVPEDTELHRFSQLSSYSKNVAELKAATEDEDLKAARTALLHLTSSCRGCHYYGGCAAMLPMPFDKVIGKKQ